jgi:hypothetical protein
LDEQLLINSLLDHPVLDRAHDVQVQIEGGEEILARGALVFQPCDHRIGAGRPESEDRLRIRMCPQKRRRTGGNRIRIRSRINLLIPNLYSQTGRETLATQMRDPPPGGLRNPIETSNCFAASSAEFRITLKTDQIPASDR